MPKTNYSKSKKILSQVQEKGPYEIRPAGDKSDETTEPVYFNKLQEPEGSEKTTEIKSDNEDQSGKTKFPYEVVVSVKMLNCRTEPKLDSKVEGRFNKGDKLKIVEERTDKEKRVWGKLEKSGWVSLAFCQKQ